MLSFAGNFFSPISKTNPINGWHACKSPPKLAETFITVKQMFKIFYLAQLLLQGQGHSIQQYPSINIACLIHLYSEEWGYGYTHIHTGAYSDLRNRKSASPRVKYNCNCSCCKFHSIRMLFADINRPCSALLREESWKVSPQKLIFRNKSY